MVAEDECVVSGDLVSISSNDLSMWDAEMLSLSLSCFICLSCRDW